MLPIVSWWFTRCSLVAIVLCLSQVVRGLLQVLHGCYHSVVFACCSVFISCAAIRNVVTWLIVIPPVFSMVVTCVSLFVTSCSLVTVCSVNVTERSNNFHCCCLVFNGCSGVVTGLSLVVTWGCGWRRLFPQRLPSFQCARSSPTDCEAHQSQLGAWPRCLLPRPACLQAIWVVRTADTCECPECLRRLESFVEGLSPS